MRLTSVCSPPGCHVEEYNRVFALFIFVAWVSVPPGLCFRCYHRPWGFVFLQGRPPPLYRKSRAGVLYMAGRRDRRPCYAGVSSDRTNLSPFTKDYRGLALPCDLRVFAARQGAMLRKNCFRFAVSAAPPSPPVFGCRL